MSIKQSIPDVGQDLDSHTRTIRAIKEAVEIGQGNTREIMKSFMTLQAAANLGLVAASGLTTKIQNFLEVPLNSPWKNYDLSTFYNRFGFYKDALGRVFLRGLISSGTSATIIATLPAMFRPENGLIFACIGQTSSVVSAQRVDINPDGKVLLQAAGTLDYLSLDGISFAAYQ